MTFGKQAHQITRKVALVHGAEVDELGPMPTSVHVVRPLPCAVRPFVDEVFGSWVGRLASQYRMSVHDLDSEYALGLARGRSLGWLAAGPQSSRTLDALTVSG